MPTTDQISKRIDELEELIEDAHGEIRTLKDLISKGDQRVDRFINGEKDLGAKGMLERLIRMEEVYKQYEGLTKIFEWIEAIIKWGFRLSPFIAGAMLWAHQNLRGTDKLFGK
jgi:hypothetical protein